MSISANQPLSEVAKQERDKSVADLVNAAIDALTGASVENLAKNATGLISLVDRFNEPDVQKMIESVLNQAGAITETVNLLGSWVNNGSLARVSEMLDFIRAILDSANGALVSSVMSKAVEMGSLLDQVAGSSVIQLVPGAIDALEGAYRQTGANGEGAKLRDIIGLVRDPRTLSTLKMLLLFLQGMDGVIHKKNS